MSRESWQPGGARPTDDDFNVFLSELVEGGWLETKVREDGEEMYYLSEKADLWSQHLGDKLARWAKARGIDNDVAAFTRYLWEHRSQRYAVEQRMRR